MPPTFCLLKPYYNEVNKSYFTTTRSINPISFNSPAESYK